jgi:3-phenylpropionate/trans-cinnamate dioxygenase ferredoxin subunit
MQSSFVKVAEKNEVPIGTTKAVKVGNKDILLANVNGSFYAVGLKCTHMGGDLSKSQLEASIVTCPKHHAKYDVTNGKVVAHPKMPLMHPKASDLETFETKIEDNIILIKL